jgi:hypothetical protein
MLTNNNSFKWPTKFQCVLIRNNTLLVNRYNISILMSPEPTDQESFTLGFRKLKYFISNYLDNSIIINQDNPNLKNIIWIESNTVQLPKEPHDYFLASILYQKFTSIVKDFFSIFEVTVDSDLGDNVEYKINYANKDLYDVQEWWCQDNVNTNSYDKFPSWDSLKIMSVNKFEPKVVIGGKGENR